MTRRASHLLAAGMIAAFAAAAVGAMRQKAATSDEPVHLGAGYSYLVTRDFRLNPEHPPLVKLLGALALAPLRPPLPLEDESWRGVTPDEFRFGALFLYAGESAAAADRLLFLGRLPTLALALVLGALVYRWGLEMGGPATGLTALALTLACPEVLGHAQLVTTDLPVTTFLVLACYAARNGLASPGAAVRFGLVAGLAMSAKFSGLLVWPMAALFLAAAPPPPGPWRRRLLAVVLVTASVLAVIWASYLGSASPLAYVQGLGQVNVNHNPDYPYYLLGEFRRGRFWSYFLIAYLVKMPLGFLAAVALGLAAAVRLRPRREMAPLVLAPLLVFAAATLRADNLGVRYVLPATPFLALVAATGLRTAGRLRPLAPALALLTALEAGARWPDDLSFFNLAVGGPARGPLYLDDSNIDWGQDLKRVPRYLREHQIKDGTLVFYWTSSAPPQVYVDMREVRIGLDASSLYRLPTSGTYLVGAQWLVRLKDPREPRGTPDWLRDLRPVGRIGYGIRVYRFGGGAASGGP